MKVLIASHHFPPHYVAGVELYTYRLARWLARAGHEVQVVCVESIGEGGRQPRCVEDVYEGIPVHRLYFDLAAAPDPFRWQFWNPEIGDWFGRFLSETQPDLVHLNSCYLLSASVIAATHALGIPLALTLHDFWFLCPRITLQRPNGTLCQVPEDPAECVWCLLTEKRRYRLPDVWTRGYSGRIAVWAMHQPALLRLTGWQARLDAVCERRRRLADALSLVALSWPLRDSWSGCLSPTDYRLTGFVSVVTGWMALCGAAARLPGSNRITCGWGTSARWRRTRGFTC